MQGVGPIDYRLSTIHWVSPLDLGRESRYATSLAWLRGDVRTGSSQAVDRLTLLRPRRLAWPRTPAFHVGNTSSNLVGDAILPILTGSLFSLPVSVPLLSASATRRSSPDLI